MRKLSTVPQASLPCSAWLRSARLVLQHQRILVAEKYGSRTRPVFSRANHRRPHAPDKRPSCADPARPARGPRPCRRRAPKRCSSRVGCDADGGQRARLHTRLLQRSRHTCATDCQISPRLLDPARLRVILASAPWRRAEGLTRRVRRRRPVCGGSLIDRQGDTGRHGSTSRAKQYGRMTQG